MKKLDKINIKFMNKKVVTKGLALVLAGTMALSLSGCISEEIGESKAHYDVLDTQNDDIIKNGITQELEVKDQPFKLKVKYNIDLKGENSWRITNDKKINTQINTIGLPEGYEVYIDNIHTDTTIVSHFAIFDGVVQDSMDDRIHNSLDRGFRINDNIYYYGINEIEGQNDTFISGYAYAMAGYGNGGISQRRRLESDFLEHGVYANKIASVIDLLVHTPNMEKGVYQAISVGSDIIVTCNNIVEFVDIDSKKTTYRVYYIENNTVKYDEYDNLLDKEKIKQMTK